VKNRLRLPQAHLSFDLPQPRQTGGATRSADSRHFSQEQM
jgi:hypothetical protein